MGDLRLSGAAAGPAPWKSLAGLIGVAVALSIAAAAAGSLGTAAVAMAAVAAFWLIVPKGSAPRAPRWIALPMIPAFVAMLFLPALFGAVERDLIAVGYAVGFVLWLQLGLWLTERFERIRGEAAADAPGPSASGDAEKLRTVVLVVVVAGLLLTLAYGVVERRGGEPGEPAAFYPPASSTAGPMTPEWTRYAAAIDRACALNYNATLALQAEVESGAGPGSASEAETLAAIHGLWAQNQRALAEDVRALGEPPAEPGLLDRWLSNVERRGELFAAMAAATRRGAMREAASTGNRIGHLKREADRLGREFGLRICTSN